MRNPEVTKRVNKEAIETAVMEKAAGELKELVDKYGVDLVVKQFELEEWSKKLGEYLAEQDIEKRKGNSYANKHGEIKRTGGADLKNFGLTSRLAEHIYGQVSEGIHELVTAAITPKRGAKPAYYGILREIVSICDKDTEEITRSVDIITSLTTRVMLECVVSGSEVIANAIATRIVKTLREEIRTEKLLAELSEKNLKGIASGLDKRVGAHFKIYYVKHSMQEFKIPFNEWQPEAILPLGWAIMEIAISRSPYFTLLSPPYPTKENDCQTLELRASAALVEAWTKNIRHMMQRASRFCPTLIPPKKWTAFRAGGYYGVLAGRASLLRLQTHITEAQTTRVQTKYLRRLEQANIQPVLDAINAIQETPWQVNRQVLRVLQYNNTHNKAWGGTPYFEPEEKPLELVGDYSEEELRAHKRKFVKYYRAETRRVSKALRLKDIEYTAEEYSQYERIYFPHNMDFRGRVYPVFPTLSPQGDDVGKALIKFADAPPITDEASLKYFYIQGANVAGIDKVSIEDRLQWIKTHHEEILASASDPTGNLWWEQQDEPWQFLAFCFEYKALHDYRATHNGSAIGWVTGLPFAQDGSCSGIQHYSAASRDEIGGKAVNLVPQEKPNDIYGFYAEKVNKILSEDSANGTLDETKEVERDGEMKSILKLGTKSLAQRWLAYGITRKTAKRPVMTLPYGATTGGYKGQILEDTIEPAKQAGQGAMFEGFESQMAIYLAKVISQCVSGLNAVKYMDWLRKVTDLITKNGNVVTWVTPLGLPVQQSYMEANSVTLRLRINGIIRRMYYQQPTGNIDSKGQKQGTPPNFIHSMDACHLQMTVLSAYAQGIRHFAMIHDSYGAPVAQGQIMFDTVRDQFVRMYQDNDIFGQFEQNAKLYIQQGADIPKLPKKGKLEVSTIKQSLYAFL